MKGERPDCDNEKRNISVVICDTGVTNGAGITYPSGAPEFNPGF